MQEKWIGRLNEAYQPFRNLYIDFAPKQPVTDYIHSAGYGKRSCYNFL